MGGKGNSGAQSTMVGMQQQQAAQATQANIERNARLNYSMQEIKNIFEGRRRQARPRLMSPCEGGSDGR